MKVPSELEFQVILYEMRMLAQNIKYFRHGAGSDTQRMGVKETAKIAACTCCRALLSFLVGTRHPPKGSNEPPANKDDILLEDWQCTTTVPASFKGKRVQFNKYVQHLTKTRLTKNGRPKDSDIKQGSREVLNTCRSVVAECIAANVSRTRATKTHQQVLDDNLKALGW